MGKQSARAEVEEAGYSPLGSVWGGEDSELFENMLVFYPRKRPKLILDAAINGGRFWRGSKRPVLGMDIEILHRPDVVADKTAMPFRDPHAELQRQSTAGVAEIETQTTSQSPADS